MTRHNNPNNPYTSIKVKRTTRDMLDELREYPKEYLDLVIMRLIKKVKRL